VPDRLVTVAKFADSVQADLARQLLADFGIEAILTGQHAANVYAGVPAVADIELQTLESEARQAKEILDSHQKRES